MLHFLIVERCRIPILEKTREIRSRRIMKTNDQMKQDEKNNAPVKLDVLTILEQLGIDRANLPQDLFPIKKNMD
jgi:hypothetical protein